jgi:Fe-S-cluster containining protein
MLLSEEDIERLERIGYRKEFFVCFDDEGYPTLRNQKGKCVFFDAEKVRCKVYKHRPLGCSLYPVIFDELKGIIVDNICCTKDNLTEEEIERKGKKVVRLIEKIEVEAKTRCSA